MTPDLDEIRQALAGEPWELHLESYNDLHRWLTGLCDEIERLRAQIERLSR